MESMVGPGKKVILRTIYEVKDDPQMGLDKFLENLKNQKVITNGEKYLLSSCDNELFSSFIHVDMSIILATKNGDENIIKEGEQIYFSLGTGRKACVICRRGFKGEKDPHDKFYCRIWFFG